MADPNTDDKRPAAEQDRHVSRRAILLWTLACVLVPALAVFAGLVVVPTIQVHRALAANDIVITGDSDDRILITGAAAVIEALGGKAAAARRLGSYTRMPKLLASRRGEAFAVLCACGRPAIPRLLDAAASEDPAERARAAFNLSLVGAVTKGTRNRWVIGEPDDRVVEAMERLIADPDPQVATTALHSAWRMVPREELLESGIIVRMRSRNDQLRRAAVACAFELRLSGERVLQVLLKLSGHSDATVRWNCAGLLGSRFRKKAAPAVPALARDLAGSDAYMRRRAAWTLGRIGSASEPAVPALAKLLKDKDYSVRKQASLALKRIGAASRAAAPELGQALFSRDRGVRTSAGWALAAIGREGMPYLIKGLKSERAEVRASAVDACRGAGDAGKPALHILDRLAREGQSQKLRKQAAEAAEAIRKGRKHGWSTGSSHVP